MNKSTKTQRLREETRAAVQQSKQTTFDNLPEPPNKEFVESAVHEPKKKIVITEIDSATKEDELVLRVGFRLLPSKTAFSKLTAELYFDGQKLHTLRFRMLQGPLATDNSEFTSALDMKGVSAGSHLVKVEINELWDSGEKLACASKEVTVEYVPLRREDRLVKVPMVTSVAGADLLVISDHERDIYHEIENSVKKEETSKRDEW